MHNNFRYDSRYDNIFLKVIAVSNPNNIYYQTPATEKKPSSAIYILKSYPPPRYQVSFRCKWLLTSLSRNGNRNVPNVFGNDSVPERGNNFEVNPQGPCLYIKVSNLLTFHENPPPPHIIMAFVYIFICLYFSCPHRHYITAKIS